MILLLSGEGTTDLGTMKPMQAGRRFTPGPMAVIVDRLLAEARRLGYSVLELHENGAESVVFLSEGDLAALRGSKARLLQGTYGKRDKDCFRGAFLLGLYAKSLSAERKTPVLAVFFRDSDGTNSSPRDIWRNKFSSMENGFKLADFDFRVPMIPRPKSEAWMLCGLIKATEPERDCSWLEEAPGNDKSPKALKTQLEDYIHEHFGWSEPASREQQADLVREGKVCVERIDLDSFKAFVAVLDSPFPASRAPLN